LGSDIGNKVILLYSLSNIIQLHQPKTLGLNQYFITNDPNFYFGQPAKISFF
jgi:hypothetical protein